MVPNKDDVIKMLQDGQMEDPSNPTSLAYPEVMNMLAAGKTEEVAQWLASQGDMWAKKVAANPALGINYKQSWWQRFGSAFGFRTGYDKFLEMQQAQSKQYIADLLDQYYQELYNKPKNQVDLMRQAGQNPDLLGTGDVQAAPNAATDNDGMDPSAFDGGTAGDAVGVVAQIGSQISSCMSSLQSAIGAAFNFQNLAEDLRSKKMANGNGLVELASSLIGKYSPATLGFSDDPDKGWSDIMNDTIDPSRLQTQVARNVAAMKLGLRKKDINRLVGLMSDMVPMLGGRQIIHEGQLKLAESRGANILAQGNMYQNPSYMSDKQMWEALRPVQKMEEDMMTEYYKIAQKMQRLQKVQTENQIAYQETYDPQVDAQAYNAQVGNQLTYEKAFRPGLAAQAANMNNEIALLQAEWTKTFKKAQNEMLARVQKKAADGNFFSKLMMNSIIAYGFITDTGIGNVITGAVNLASRAIPGVGALMKGVNSGPAQKFSPTYIYK